MSLAATQQGVILGTAAYMSPEQARGVPVDKRADIWAFGCILFEMLTGRQAFQGELVSDVMASVLARDPEYTTLQTSLHPSIQPLLRRCLNKEPKDRWQAAGDVRIEIEQALADPNGLLVQPAADVISARPRSTLPWVAAMVLAVALTAIAVWALKPSLAKPVTRFPFLLPEGQAFSRPGRSLVAISPDGTQFVYVADQQLHLRNLGEMEARPIPGTDEDVSGPFFSPDGEWIGFYSFSDGQLKKIAITGGTSIRLCDAVPPGGASWSGDGSILFSQPEGIMRVSENGGEPTLLIATAEGEQAASPQLLPGGDEVLFSLASTAGGNRWNEGQVVVESLGTDDRKVVVEGGSDGTYVPTGHVVYALENVLFAVPFDLSRLERTGGPVAVLDPVKRALGGASANYGFSAGGTLVYVPRAGGAAGSARHLVWVDRDGNETNLTQEPGSYQFPRVSPDGRRIAFEIIREGSGTEIGLIEISSGNYSQLTFTDGGEQNPTWTPDARRLGFRGPTLDGPGLQWMPADGSSAPELLLPESGGRTFPISWSPDGSKMTIYWNDGGNRRIGIFDMDSREASVFLDTPANERGPMFSPNGAWVAYTSNELGQDEVFVQPYPQTGAKYRISAIGGSEPVWSPDGTGLFYRSDTRLMMVDIDPSTGFTPGNPLELFEGTYHGDTNSQGYDVHPDGDRFLMVKPVMTGRTDPIFVVLNWFEELKERVPVP